MTDTIAEEDVPIPFKLRIDLDDCEKVTLVHEVNNAKKKKEMLLADQLDAKLILTMIAEFSDVCQTTHVNLSTGALKFEKFHECLAGPVQDDWDAAKVGKPETNEGFTAAIATFVAGFLDEDSLEE